MACIKCGFQTCFRHKLPWESHGALTCDEFQSRREHGDPNHKATKEYLEHETKNCPGPTCGIPVEKGDGCFYMICQYYIHHCDRNDMWLGFAALIKRCSVLQLLFFLFSLDSLSTRPYLIRPACLYTVMKLSVPA